MFAPAAGRLGLRKCRGCSLVMVNPRPDSRLLGAFYGGNSYVCHQADHSPGRVAKARHLLAVLDRFAPRREGASLLDYGCGGGFFLRQALAAGWRAMGYDIGERALRLRRPESARHQRPGQPAARLL